MAEMERSQLDDVRRKQLQQSFLNALNRVQAEKDGQRQNHQLGVEQDEDPGVVQAPLAVQAARRFHHAPERGEHRQELPVRRV